MEVELERHGIAPAAAMLPGLSDAARGLPLHNRDGSIRAFAIVDADDYEWASRHNWSLGSHGYARRNAGDGTWPQLHREVLGLPYGQRGENAVGVEHLNRDRLDCRRTNLCIREHRHNRQNTSGWRDATSRYRGVSWDAGRERWKAQATLDGRNYFIGRYQTEQEAADAAAAWREKHMPFATD